MVFLLGFTCTTIWIMGNLYRAIMINEYATVSQEYRKLEPGDLLEDPWPTLDPQVYWNERIARRAERRHNSVIKRRQKVEWRELLDEQKEKQRNFIANFKERQKLGDNLAKLHEFDKQMEKKKKRTRRRSRFTQLDKGELGNFYAIMGAAGRLPARLTWRACATAATTASRGARTVSSGVSSLARSVSR